MNIGDWVQREKRGVPHLVESIVSGDVVTKCGKRMRNEPNRDGGLTRASLIDEVFNKCRSCNR
jgi:hypothetical protein